MWLSAGSRRAQQKAQAFNEGRWEQYIREFVPEHDRARKSTRGHFLRGAFSTS